MKIELLRVPRCPHVDAARALLNECLTELQLEVAVEDKEGAWTTPIVALLADYIAGDRSVGGEHRSAGFAV